MNTPLYTWARKHGLTWQCVEELRSILGIGASTVPSDAPAYSEAAVQSRVRLEAPKRGYCLYRNNVGVLLDSRGVPVSFGLANETRAMNRVLKSSDLIGWKPKLVTPCMVGSYVAVFCSFEIKEATWQYSGNAHEKAQLAWIENVAKDGGIARFITHERQL